MKPNFYFDELFMQNFWFFHAWEPAKVNRYMKKRFKEDFDTEFLGDGKTILYRPEKLSPLIMIWIKKKNDFPVIAHEAVHAANFCLDLAGVSPDFRNDETQAYLVGLICKKLLRQ